MSMEELRLPHEKFVDIPPYQNKHLFKSLQSSPDILYTEE